MSRPAVRARALTKSYAGRLAVDGIDFEVRAGECFGFLGPNGAGKTTTMKMIYGLASIGAGSLEVLGHDAARERRAVKARLGVVPQEENLDKELTVQENLLVQASYFGLRGASAQKRAHQALAFARLADRAGARVQELSGGMRRRLLIARSLVNRPALVVLDEPTTGLDPQARQSAWATLEALRAQGVTLLLTTHYMEEAARLCDRLVIMERGRIVTEGSPAELTARYGQPHLEAVFLHLTGHGLGGDQPQPAELAAQGR